MPSDQNQADNINTSRPRFIGHYKEFLKEPWSYPGSDEKMGATASVGKHLGLQKMGVHIVQLSPGHRSSWPHAESTEEEFVYIISGTPTAWIDGHTHQLEPGDFIAFPAGTGITHTFINNSKVDALLLVGGEASRKDNQVTYPLHPKRNEEMRQQGLHWEKAPSQQLGPHNGQPN